MRYLIVDGMLSGTGVRDALEGDYVELAELGISQNLKDDITSWLARYELAHYARFDDPRVVDALDAAGLKLRDRLANELPEAKIEYFSAARIKTLKW